MIDRAQYIRPSALAAIEICPGRPLMEARSIAVVPAIEKISRPAAEQGTLGHSVVAQTLALIYHQPGGWVLPDDAIAQMAPLIEKLNTWTRDAVRRCVAYAVALVDQANSAGYSPHIQIEIHLSGKGINIARGGTADFIILCKKYGEVKLDWVIVADWKLGFLDQGNAADNLQLGAYAVMAHDKYEPRHGVTVHLAQGRNQDFSGADYSANDIERVRERIIAAVGSAWDDRPELKPYIDSCRYCKAITQCRALRENVMHAAEQNALFGDRDIDKIKLASDAALARRFAEDARELAKQWKLENAGKKSCNSP